MRHNDRGTQMIGGYFNGLRLQCTATMAVCSYDHDRIINGICCCVCAADDGGSTMIDECAHSQQPRGGTSSSDIVGTKYPHVRWVVLANYHARMCVCVCFYYSTSRSRRIDRRATLMARASAPFRYESHKRSHRDASVPEHLQRPPIRTAQSQSVVTHDRNTTVRLPI